MIVAYNPDLWREFNCRGCGKVTRVKRRFPYPERVASSADSRANLCISCDTKQLRKQVYIPSQEEIQASCQQIKQKKTAKMLPA